VPCFQTDLGATPLHLLLASSAQALSLTGEHHRAETCSLLRLLLEAGARDDLKTADGDCAARLIAELVAMRVWDPDGRIQDLLDAYSRGVESEPAGEALLELGVLSAPLVALVLDYNGHAQVGVWPRSMWLFAECCLL
jgi:hypothetical protein